MNYKLRLLTTGAFGSLTRMEQSLALDLARHLGMRAALGEIDPERPAPPTADAYYRAAVLPAAALGLVEGGERDEWERACANGAEAHDPRVRMFLVAWRERVRLLAEEPPLVLPVRQHEPRAREVPGRRGAA